jgi:molybdate transport system ATP-binding protein
MSFVSFKEDSRLFSYSEHYYQQRFEFADEADPLTLDSFLRAGIEATAEEITVVADRLGINGSRTLSFIKLSNGQVRRARIARALLHHPELLILDDPFVGLDAIGREELGLLLGELVRKGQRVLLVTRRDHVPTWVTHVLKLGKGTAEIGSNERSEVMGTGGRALPISASHHDSPLAEPILELQHVFVRHGGRAILQDVSWAVRVGERWALVGPNGAGKTTLLSLVCGDHPQAYSNDIRLFGRQRGTGESVWEVKRKIGLVSPEFHLYFGGALTAFEAAVTGFYDVLAYRQATPEQAESVRDLFAAFDLEHLAARPFARLSSGEQRLVLLVRALVKRPPLLILDEPFQGFDTDTVGLIRDWLDRELAPPQALIFVSHLAHEVPRTVTHRLELAEGRVAGLTL